ncbi:unnamed protein product [Withania somnifera]
MTEKCLLMTSLAILVCHPSSTIRCFKPKPSSTTSPKKEKNPSKSRNGLVFTSCTNICDSPILNVHKPFKLLDEIFGWKHGVGYKIEKILKVNLRQEVSERVFYHSTTVTCSLGLDKSTRICSKNTCGVCKIIGQSYGTHEETICLESFSTSCWSEHRKIMKPCGDGVSNKAIIVSRVIESCKGEKNGENIHQITSKVHQVKVSGCNGSIAGNSQHNGKWKN